MIRPLEPIFWPEAGSACLKEHDEHSIKVSGVSDEFSPDDLPGPTLLAPRSQQR
jgi:hypothetical protein